MEFISKVICYYSFFIIGALFECLAVSSSSTVSSFCASLFSLRFRITASCFKRRWIAALTLPCLMNLAKDFTRSLSLEFLFPFLSWSLSWIHLPSCRTEDILPFFHSSSLLARTWTCSLLVDFGWCFCRSKKGIVIAADSEIDSLASDASYDWKREESSVTNCSPIFLKARWKCSFSNSDLSVSFYLFSNVCTILTT